MKTVEDVINEVARPRLEELYEKLNEKQKSAFIRMYGSIKYIEPDKIIRAIMQMENTLGI